MSIEERLDANRDALRAMRKTMSAAYRELKPQPFGEWLQEREELRERGRRAPDRSQDQEQRQEHDQEQRHDRYDGPFTRAERAGIREELLLEQ